MKKKSYSTSNLPQPPSRAAVAAAEKAAQLRTTIFEQLLLSEEEKREQENIEKTTERPRTGSPKSTRFDILQLDGEDSVDPNTNTIETPFNQTGSASGGGSPIQIRKSASNPNMSSPGRMSTSRGTSRGASRGMACGISLQHTYPGSILSPCCIVVVFQVASVPKVVLLTTNQWFDIYQERLVITWKSLKILNAQGMCV